MQPVWPFPGGVDWSQFRRDDAGVDLQYPGDKPVAILAVVDGHLTTAGPDPSGFGMSYPLLELDQAVEAFTGIYYGHTFPDYSKVGTHVKRGDVIGQTGGASSGGNASGLSNWLEIGFWVPTSGNGHNMHTFLLTAKGSPANAPLPTGGIGGSGTAQRHDAQEIGRTSRAIARQAVRLLWVRVRAYPIFTNGWRP